MFQKYIYDTKGKDETDNLFDLILFKDNLINHVKAYFILLFILVLTNSSSSDEIENILFIYKLYKKQISFFFF